MDDYTWQKKIRERNFRYRRSLLSLILLIFFALGLGTGMWYFLIYIRTPEYALQQLQSAIEKKGQHCLFTLCEPGPADNQGL